MQVALIGMSVIPNGLLATPNIRIAGLVQLAAQLTWFNDQATGPLPTPWVLSVLLWWDKIAMLLWGVVAGVRAGALVTRGLAGTDRR